MPKCSSTLFLRCLRQHRYRRRDALALLGGRFRVVLDNAAPSLTDEEVGEFLLDNYVLVHLDDDGDDKFCLLVFMLQKLLRCVRVVVGVAAVSSRSHRTAVVQ
jgi:hypothetical protein